MGISDDIKPKAKTKPKKVDSFLEPMERDPYELNIRHEAGETEFFPKYESADSEDHRHSMDNFEESFFTPEKHTKPVPRAEADEHNKTEPTKNTEKKQRNSITKWVVLLFLVLIGLLVWQNYAKIIDVIGLNINSETQNDALPSYDSSATGTDYTKTTDSTKTAEKTVETPKTEPTPAPTIDKTKILIEVLNGNGTSGTASATKDNLVGAGFLVDKVTNARSFAYPTSIIYYKTGKEAEANLVKTALSTLTSEITNSDTIVGNYDIVVVVGKK